MLKMLNQVRDMIVETEMNESKRLDVTGVPCGVIAVVGDLWHFEVLAGHVFLVESLVEIMR